MNHNLTFLANPVNFCSPAPGGMGNLLVPKENAQKVAMGMATPITGVGRAYRKVPTRLRVSYCRVIDEIDISINYFPFSLALNGRAVAAEVVDNPPDLQDLAEFTTSRAKWFPVFYLPWAAGQNYRMTLKQPGNLTGGEQVRIFITSAVNGCSVFVEGTPQQPTVYHLNRAGGAAPPIGGNLLVNNTYWTPKRTAMEQAFQAAKSPKSLTALPVGAALPTPRAVHAMDYMDVTAANVPGRDGPVLLEAMQKAPDAKTLVFVQSHYLPFGTVFGWMQATTWRFFFQKRACCAFEYRATTAGGATQAVYVTRQVAWHCEEFWPTAHAGSVAIAKAIVA